MGISWIDASIFILYLLAMMGMGFYFMKRNASQEDYFVGGRSMSAGHVGLSVVATDVGGGFSIGLGGLGFTMGLSGSWMLFTGLLGAWLSAVFLIPRVYQTAKQNAFISFPQVLGHHYNSRVALLAGLVSLIGYVGFTSSQILAGAKLASATFSGLDLQTAAIVMGAVAIVYTAFGGIKAVIYTDTVQWLILIVGLLGVGLPLCYHAVGGWEAIEQSLDPTFFSFSQVKTQEWVNWAATIVPIWFVGMTLYQRIYACKSEQTAKRAWFIAGLFEWPIMAIMGVALGLIARVAFEQNAFAAVGFPAGSAIDAELGLPLLLATLLPVGMLGLMMSAYFSAIMSTADSCLMAASGTVTADIWPKLGLFRAHQSLRGSQWLTLLIGVLAIALATQMESVLNLMLYSYSFMVSGLLIPVIGFLVYPKPSSLAAFTSVWVGGGFTLSMILAQVEMPFGLDPNVFGIALAAIAFFIIQHTKAPSSNHG
jgi:SSS family solute:Na+ symporter